MKIYITSLIRIGDRAFFPGVAHVPDALGEQLLDLGATLEEGAAPQEPMSAETSGRIAAAAGALAPLVGLEAPATPTGDALAAILEAAAEAVGSQQGEADKLNKRVGDQAARIKELEKQLAEAKKAQ